MSGEKGIYVGMGITFENWYGTVWYGYGYDYGYGYGFTDYVPDLLIKGNKNMLQPN